MDLPAREAQGCGPALSGSEDEDKEEGEDVDADDGEDDDEEDSGPSPRGPASSGDGSAGASTRRSLVPKGVGRERVWVVRMDG